MDRKKTRAAGKHRWTRKPETAEAHPVESEAVQKKLIRLKDVESRSRGQQTDVTDSGYETVEDRCMDEDLEEDSPDDADPVRMPIAELSVEWGIDYWVEQQKADPILRRMTELQKV